MAKNAAEARDNALKVTGLKAVKSGDNTYGSLTELQTDLTAAGRIVTDHPALIAKAKQKETDEAELSALLIKFADYIAAIESTDHDKAPKGTGGDWPNKSELEKLSRNTSPNMDERGKEVDGGTANNSLQKRINDAGVAQKAAKLQTELDNNTDDAATLIIMTLIFLLWSFWNEDSPKDWLRLFSGLQF